MESRQTVNKEVFITAWEFRNRRLESFPKRMEYNNKEYTFADGLRYLIQKGQRAVQLFDMTDGRTKYRLKLDSQDRVWTLVSITNSGATKAF